MDLVKTGINITKTFKNMGRFREIVSVFARNGLDEFIIKTGLHTKIPDYVLPKSRRDKALSERSQDDWSEHIGYRLRKSFEELGPGFIKFGQMLSSREDLFDESFLREMRKLQNEIESVPFEKIKDSLEKSLGVTDYKAIFKEIDPNPIGTASIGVVYKGLLQNGESIVVKVRRPNIVDTIETDFSILLFMASQLERVSDEVKYLGLTRAINDFSAALQNELDFNIEASNCERLKVNTEKIDKEHIFYIPKVYNEHTREDVLVLEYLKGRPFNQISPDEEVLKEIHPKLEKGISIFVHTLLADGFFHADLHGGNFYLLDNKNIGILDFGLVGNLGRKGQMNLVSLLYALVTKNYENLVFEFLEVAEYDEIPNVDILVRDLRDTLSPILGLSVQQINFLSLFHSIVTVLSKHRIYLPRDWYTVF